MRARAGRKAGSFCFAVYGSGLFDGRVVNKFTYVLTTAVTGRKLTGEACVRRAWLYLLHCLRLPKVKRNRVSILQVGTVSQIGFVHVRPIHFRFDPEKMVHAIAFFASRGVKNLDTMKCAKLLYFADRQHLLKYGRPIIGDEYHVMKDGPIPTRALTKIQEAFKGAHDPVFDEYLRVGRTGRAYPHFELVKEPDLDVFSDSDLEVVEDVTKRLGGKTAWQLRELAHQDEGVRVADEVRVKTGRGSVHMPFQAFFDGTDSRLLPLVEEDQDKRDFADSLMA